MSARQLFLLLGTLAIGVFAYLVIISQQADKLHLQTGESKRNLDDTRYYLNNTNEKIAKVEKEIEDYNKLAQEKAALEARMTEVKLKTSTYLSEADKFEKNIEKAQVELKQVITISRSKAKGEVIPRLTLKSGQAFTNLRFQDIREHEVVFSFESGLKRVGYDDLPQHIIDRFGLTAEVKPVEKVVVDKDNDVALQKELNVAPLPKDPTIPLSQDQKKQLIATISELENTMVDWNYKLSAARNKAQNGDKTAAEQYKAIEEKVERLKTQIRTYRKRIR
jgi:hypothetical protein